MDIWDLGIWRLELGLAAQGAGGRRLLVCGLIVSFLNLSRPTSSPIAESMLAVAVMPGNTEALAEAPVKGDGGRSQDHGGFSSAQRMLPAGAGSDSKLVSITTKSKSFRPSVISELRAQRLEGDVLWTMDGGWRAGGFGLLHLPHPTHNIHSPVFRYVGSALCRVANEPQIPDGFGFCH